MTGGWRQSTLGEVARWGSGGTPQAGNAAYYGGDIPWAVIGDLNDAVVSRTAASITEEGLRRSSAKLVPEGAVLVAMYGSIGKLGVAGVRMATNQAIAFASPYEFVDRDFLFYYLLSQRHELDGAGKGATQRNIGQAILKAWPIRYPSLLQQRRIVAILEEHLSDLEAACASLDAARTRASGLPSLLAEREIRMAEQWTTVAEVSELVTDGDHNPPKRVSSGVPHVTAKGIRDGRITFEGCTYISEDGYLQTANRYSPRAGDVIVTCVGTIGRVAVVPEGIRFSADRNLAAIRPGEAMLSGYLACVLESVTLQRTMATASGATAQPHLYLRDIRSLEVPHPAVEHQAEAVERYQDARRAIGRLLVQLGRQRSRATSLRRAILAAAFSGRLTGRSSDTDVVEQLTEEPA